MNDLKIGNLTKKIIMEKIILNIERLSFHKQLWQSIKGIFVVLIIAGIIAVISMKSNLIYIPFAFLVVVLLVILQNFIFFKQYIYFISVNNGDMLIKWRDLTNDYSEVIPLDSISIKCEMYFIRTHRIVIGFKDPKSSKKIIVHESRYFTKNLMNSIVTELTNKSKES